MGLILLALDQLLVGEWLPIIPPDLTFPKSVSLLLNMLFAINITALHYFEVNGLLDKTIHSKPFKSQK